MKIFLTGATGYIGSVIAEKLLKNGHEVVGLARSEQSANLLTSKAIKVVYGDLNDLDLLTNAAAKSEGVIHTGFKNIPEGFAAAMLSERKSVHAMIKGLENHNKPFIYTGGTGLLGDTEHIVFNEETRDRFRKGRASIDNSAEMERAGIERITTEQDILKSVGVRGIVIRPPNVYGRSNGHSLISVLINASKKLGAVPYVEFSREHLWSFVHVDDLADLYLLALENSTGGELFYAGAQSGIQTQSLAEAISLRIGAEGKIKQVTMAELVTLLQNPFIAEFWSWNNQSSAEKAKQRLGWKPVHIDMLTELAHKTH